MRSFKYQLSQALIMIAIGFLICLALTSCGPRRVQKSETKEAIKTEIKEVTEQTKATEINANVITNIESDEITIEPIDTIKPMVINGKEYKNARLRHNKKKVDITDKSVVKVQEKAVKTTDIKQDSQKKVSTKDTERKQSYWWLLWLLLLIPIYYLYKKFSPLI